MLWHLINIIIIIIYVILTENKQIIKELFLQTYEPGVITNALILVKIL